MDTVYILYCKYYKYTYCIHTYYMNIILIVNCHFCYTIMFCKYILYTYICIYTVYILYEYHPHCQLSFLLHFPVVVIDRCCSNSTCPLLNQFTEHIFVYFLHVCIFVIYIFVFLYFYLSVFLYLPSFKSIH